MTQYAVYMYYLDDPGTIIYYETFEVETLKEAEDRENKILVSWWLRNQPVATEGATIRLVSNPEKLSMSNLSHTEIYGD